MGWISAESGMSSFGKDDSLHERDGFFRNWGWMDELQKRDEWMIRKTSLDDWTIKQG